MGELSRLAERAERVVVGDPAKLREMADTVERETAGRGISVRLAAASLCRELRDRASKNDPTNKDQADAE